MANAGEKQGKPENKIDMDKLHILHNEYKKASPDKVYRHCQKMLAKVKIQVMQHIVKNAVEKSVHVAFNSR